jgi:histidinol-phosphate phosphatase family protein
MSAPLYDIVVPTTGRETLAPLVAALSREADGRAGRIVVVDDRRGAPDLALGVGLVADARLRIERSGGRGPAAARNVGIRSSSAPWVVFVDDDVELGAGWGAALARDLSHAAREVGGVQGRVVVPLTSTRPTDWERNVAALADAPWITADMAYRRAALLATGGFDERFPRAYREDADLALRVLDAGWQLRAGARTVRHPVRPAPWWVSIAKQRGNVDDALMSAVHGRGWRERIGATRGRARRHAIVTVAACAGSAAVAARRRTLATALLLLWAALTAEFAATRLAPGPRTRGEIGRIGLTSVVIPPYAVALRVAGAFKHRRAARVPRGAEPREPIEAVIVDRDGTIVVDVPYNGDPARVEPAATAQAALTRLRTLGLPVVMATNQSGIGRGLLSREEVDSVNRRVVELLGPFAGIEVCPHVDEDGCPCRKPAPGLILDAATALHTDPRHCVVIGDCGADVAAARRAGARAILVPNPVTRAEEISEAPLVADDLETAAAYVAAMVAR